MCKLISELIVEAKHEHLALPVMSQPAKVICSLVLEVVVNSWPKILPTLVYLSCDSNLELFGGVECQSRSRSKLPSIVQVLCEVQL